MRKSQFTFADVMRRIRRFARDNQAIAAVEFALVLPFMLMLYIGSVELGTAITADRKVANVAGAVGDLVARAEDKLTFSKLTDYFAASQAIMRPYDTTLLKQVVTCVFVDNNGVAKVSWSYGYNGGTAYTVNSTYLLPPEMTNLVSNGYVIVAEAKYDHEPMLGYFFEDTFRLSKQFFYLPRYGGFIQIT
jgi:Flp pilus assembly protein TadG